MRKVNIIMFGRKLFGGKLFGEVTVHMFVPRRTDLTVTLLGARSCNLPRHCTN